MAAKKIATGYIGNALRSSAADHTTTFTDEVFDIERQKYQSEVNAGIEERIETERNRAEAAEKAIIFDVSAYNNGAVFESISALLSSTDLNTLIPTSFRHGGMTIRFIQGSEQSSDNKYVQYRLMSTAWSTNVSNWQGVDDEPTAGSDNLVKSGGVANKISELESKTKYITNDTVKIGVIAIVNSSPTSYPVANGKYILYYGNVMNNRLYLCRDNEWSIVTDLQDVIITYNNKVKLYKKDTSNFQEQFELVGNYNAVDFYNGIPTLGANDGDVCLYISDSIIHAAVYTDESWKIVSIGKKCYISYNGDVYTRINDDSFNGIQNVGGNVINAKIFKNSVPSSDEGKDEDYAVYVGNVANQRLYRKIKGAWVHWRAYNNIFVLYEDAIYKKNHLPEYPFEKIISILSSKDVDEHISAHFMDKVQVVSFEFKNLVVDRTVVMTPYPIKIVKGEKNYIYIKNDEVHSLSLWKYNVDHYEMVFDFGSNDYSQGKVFEFEVPADAEYDTLVLRTYVETTIEEIKIYTEIESIKIDPLVLKSKISYWNDKNVVVYGDSITAQGNEDERNSYLYYAKQEHGFRNLYVRGVGGQTYMYNNITFYAYPDGRYAGRAPETQPIGSTEHKGAFCSWDRITAMIPENIRHTIDLVVLCGGTNDFLTIEEVYVDAQLSANEPEWKPDDKTDTVWGNSSMYNGGDYDIMTFEGAIASTVMKMQLWCPNAVVVVATPFPAYNMETKQQRTNQYGVKFRNVCVCEEQIAHYISAPVIDANGHCGISGINFPECVVDGVHPNETGRKLFGRVFCGELRRVAEVVK